MEEGIRYLTALKENYRTVDATNRPWREVGGFDPLFIRTILGAQRDRNTRTFYSRITCTSGLSISIQAGDGLYSSPRSDFHFYGYQMVELGFPSHACTILDDYAGEKRVHEAAFARKQPRCPNTGRFQRSAFNKDGNVNTVYPYVPAEMVYHLIYENNGGVVKGEHPPLNLGDKTLFTSSLCFKHNEIKTMVDTLEVQCALRLYRGR